MDLLFSGDADDWADVCESFGRGQMADDAPDGVLLGQRRVRRHRGPPSAVRRKTE
jgi:hypothetical protein